MLNEEAKRSHVQASSVSSGKCLCNEANTPSLY